jgi:Uma2 family endonuclease
MAPTSETAAALAWQPDDEREYELVNGQWEVKEMGSMRHSGVGSRLLARMLMHVEAHQLGGVYGPDATFQIGRNERLPDVSFLSAARFPAGGELDEKCPVAPDLAVEVISPHEIWEKVQDKLNDYFQAGVQQVWLVALKHRQIHLYDSPTRVTILTETEELTSATLLPGFRCLIGDLFTQPAPLPPLTP